jgi:Mg2+ and Co2+ transporter CorA
MIQTKKSFLSARVSDDLREEFEHLCISNKMETGEMLRHMIRSYSQFEEMRDLLVKVQNMNNKLVETNNELLRKIDAQRHLINVIMDELPDDSRLKNVQKMKEALHKLYDGGGEDGSS